MKKLLCIGVVMMLATVATSRAVGGGEEWTCNTTCSNGQGFEYVQVSYGSGPGQAYDNLSCREGFTVSGDINCWENNLLD